MTLKTTPALAKAPAKAAALRDRTPYRVTSVRSALLILTDDDQLARLVAGEYIPHEERKTRRAPSGEIVRDLPTISVPSLLASGKIEPVEDAPAPAAEGGEA